MYRGAAGLHGLQWRFSPKAGFPKPAFVAKKECPRVTNRLAIILGSLIVGAIVLDAIMGWGVSLFLARRLVDLIEWIIFWR